MNTLIASDLVVSYYGEMDVLQGVSIEAPENQITVVIGPNGAGKSTLLKTIYGLLRPHAGSIFFDGQDLTRCKVHHLMEMGLAYVPQARSVFPELTVKENLELGCWVFRKDNGRVKQALDYVFQFFPILFEKASHKAGSLSGGQQKILEVGRALLTQPRLLLLDEPTTTLAPKLAREIYAFLARLKELETTVILVDQNVRQAMEIADHVYVLELGKNHASGTRQDFEGRLQDVIRDWLA